MPGFETIDKQELKHLKKIFQNGGGVLFRHGFENIRGSSFQVEEFEKNLLKNLKVNMLLQ